MKKRSNIKTIALLIGVVLTAVLSIAVVVVSLKLRDIGSEPVAPTAPRSQPKADDLNACNATFTVEAPTPISCYKISPTPWASWTHTFSVLAADAPDNLFDYKFEILTDGQVFREYVMPQDGGITCDATACSSSSQTTTELLGFPQAPTLNTAYTFRAYVKPRNARDSEYVTSAGCTMEYYKAAEGSADCKEKRIFKNEASNTEGNYTLRTEIGTGSTVQPGDVLVFNLMGEALTQPTSGSVVWTDVLHNKLEWMDGEDGCDYAQATRTVTCDMGIKAAGEDYDTSFRVRVLSSATPGEISNTATVTTGGTNKNVCSIAVVLPSTSPSPSPSPSPVVSPTPGNDAGFEVEKFKDVNGNGSRDDGEIGLSWEFEWDLNGDNNWRAYVSYADQNGKGGRVGGLHEGDVVRVREKGVDGWVSTTLTTQTTTLRIGQTQLVRFGNKPKVVVSCNSTCTTTSDCMSGLVCSSGFCRNSVCTSEADCACPPVVKATSTPTPELPKSGSVTGTTAVFGLGALVVVLGIIGFLAL